MMEATRPPGRGKKGGGRNRERKAGEEQRKKVGGKKRRVKRRGEDKRARKEAGDGGEESKGSRGPSPRSYKYSWLSAQALWSTDPDLSGRLTSMSSCTVGPSNRISRLHRLLANIKENNWNTY